MVDHKRPRPIGVEHEQYHESSHLLSEETMNVHRAILSLKEELEAIDWYQQRAEACSDDELTAVLVHNKNEEVEHAMMTLEWLRRRSPVFATNVETYLNSNGPIAAADAGTSGSRLPESESCSQYSLGIGGLKGAR